MVMTFLGVFIVLAIGATLNSLNTNLVLDQLISSIRREYSKGLREDHEDNQSTNFEWLCVCKM